MFNHINQLEKVDLCRCNLFQTWAVGVYTWIKQLKGCGDKRLDMAGRQLHLVMCSVQRWHAPVPVPQPWYIISLLDSRIAIRLPCCMHAGIEAFYKSLDARLCPRAKPALD